MNDLLLCFLLSSLVGTALSVIHVVEPLDIQLPPVARVNQSYSWTFSGRTFNLTDGSLSYTTSALPGWLSFNPENRTFYGTPTLDDEGYPWIAVTAHSTISSVSATSGAHLCVSSDPAPTVSIPIPDQFAGAPGPGLSSVFSLGQRSAIATGNPAVRIPPTWSFSIGFQRQTATWADGGVFYEARSGDGGDLPEWMVFNSNAVTLDGVVPAELGTTSPAVISLVLLASDQEGYTALSLPFDIVVANHELSAATDALPIINVTSGNPFTFDLISPVDFTGILVDGSPIQPSNISAVQIDTSAHSWLRYDPASRTLSGTPAQGDTVEGDRPTLPVNLTSTFNQTIRSKVTLQIVPSYFIFSELPALHLLPGEEFNVQLGQYYSNSTAGRRGDADISATYDPLPSANFLRFNSATDSVSGRIADDFTGDHITLSFTAYSRITHSTSHANLIIFLSRNSTQEGRGGPIGRPKGLSVQSKRRLALGFGITLGVVGGLVAMTAFFACVRRVARLEGSVLEGEEGRRAWSDKDRRYYGFGTDPSLENQYRRSIHADSEKADEDYMDPPRNAREYGPRDLELQRVPERSQSIPGSYVTSDVLSSARMSKREFVARVKQTVRQVSNKYSSVTRGNRSRPSPHRPYIGKPILIRPSIGVEPDFHYPLQGSASNPFDDRYSQRGSTFMTGSPSASTGEHSIPRRRADFAPPRALVQVHFEDGKLVRQSSNVSLKSGIHGRVSRTTSMRSVRSGRSTRTTSLLSHEYYPDGPASPDEAAAQAKPRLVPFTSSTRVPVPRSSSLVVPTGDGEYRTGTANLAKTRIASQRAKVYKEPNGDDDPFKDNVRRSVSADDLSMGLHYVQSLGNDRGQGQGTAVSAEGAGTKTNLQEATRYVVRTGEKFHIRIQIPVTTRSLQVQQVSGLALPSFLRFDANGTKGLVEFTGTALSRDLGVLNVGIYADKECVARVSVEVIPRR